MSPAFSPVPPILTYHSEPALNPDLQEAFHEPPLPEWEHSVSLGAITNLERPCSSRPSPSALPTLPCGDYHRLPGPSPLALTWSSSSSSSSVSWQAVCRKR